MSQLYSGIINLSKIPKDLIRKNRNGDSIIYVDFAERKSPSQYGDTHYIKLYDSTNRTQHYIGDFKLRELGSAASSPAPAAAPAPAPAPSPAPAPMPESLDPQDDDLPF